MAAGFLRTRSRLRAAGPDIPAVAEGLEGGGGCTLLLAGTWLLTSTVMTTRTSRSLGVDAGGAVPVLRVQGGTRQR